MSKGDNGRYNKLIKTYDLSKSKLFTNYRNQYSVVVDTRIFMQSFLDLVWFMNENVTEEEILDLLDRVIMLTTVSSC